jgi:hypothetical protein
MKCGNSILADGCPRMRSVLSRPSSLFIHPQILPKSLKKNPVILWGHDDRGYTGSNGMPVAKAENIRVDANKLMMTLRFPSPETDEFGNRVFRMMRDGFINAVSVGFHPINSD